MRAYRPPLEARGGSLRLDFNENTQGAPPTVRRALARLSSDRLAMYPEYANARRALAGAFGVRSGELLLTNGTDDALHLVADVFSGPGRDVLVLEPTYAMYRFYAERAGARVRRVRYGPGFAFPERRLLAALRRRPSVLFLANPNNPTGTLASPDQLARALDAARRTTIVVDEAYADFSGVTVLPWIRRHANLVVTRTFSKAGGIAGLRLGCLMTNRRTALVLARAHSPYSVNAAALAAGCALARRCAATAAYVADVRAARDLLARALAGLGVRVFPSAANFVLADFGPEAGTVVRRLAARGILVRDRRSDFPRPGFVRLTAGTRSQTRRLIRALEEVCP